MRSVLGVVIAATFAAGLAVVIDEARMSNARRAPQIDIEERIEVVPPPGQAEVRGTATLVVAKRANTPPLPLPLHFETGSARIEQAIVEGERATIEWAGGQPLDLAGVTGSDGGLDLGPTTVEVRADGVFWPIDGAPRTFLPGSYRIDAPVAVGRGGLASPQDNVTFDADGDTTLTTAGGITTRTEPAALELDGPGDLRVEGDLSVRTAEGTQQVTVLDFGPGPFTVSLTPAAGGWTLEATIRGPRTVQLR